MMTLTNAGRRVRLTRVDDAFTRLRPGALGTVTYERDCPISGRTIAVDWDEGSKLTLLLDEGDALEFIE
jgi:hypothetical protein